VIVASPEQADRERANRARLEAASDAASMGTVQHARGRSAEELVALVSLGLVLLADLVLIRLGLDAEDEGYFLEQATRVVQGQLPYRDFDSFYTPALLYVHAAVLSLFSTSPVIDIRVVSLLGRVLLGGGLYVLCRPLARPALAVLPALYILLGLDRAPAVWEPHPGWPSAGLTVVAACAFARLPFAAGARRNALLVALGGTAALVFVFKQNAGVLLGLALLVMTAWQGIDDLCRPVTRGLRAVQVGLLVLVLVAIGWLISPHASPSVLAYFLIPMLAAGAAALLPVAVSDTGRDVASWLRVLGWLALGGSIVSLPWLIALLVALDWNVALLKGFIGAVNQNVLWYPLQGPSGGAWASLLGVAVGLLAVVRLRRWPLLCGAALLVVLAFATCMVALTGATDESVLVATLLAPARAASGVALLLVPASIVAGAALSLRLPPSRTAWWLRWMTVASALTFLTQYPRMDEVHLAWSAALPLATGAVVLGHLGCALARRWQAVGASRYLLAGALVLVPSATVLLNVLVSSADFVSVHNKVSFGLKFVPRTRLSEPPIVAGMTVSSGQASTLVAAAQFVAANSTPGQPIFVYPTSPLVYVLANRPNPTRFAHLYPGAATPSEVNAVIATLDRLPVQLVVVFESDLAYWGPPHENAPLETYLVDNYHQVAQFDEYRVLRRN
jgi:hypothetical protein